MFEPGQQATPSEEESDEDEDLEAGAPADIRIAGRVRIEVDPDQVHQKVISILKSYSYDEQSSYFPAKLATSTRAT